MKTIVKLQILTDENKSKKLLNTIEQFNAVCNEIAEICFKEKTSNKYDIHHLVYYKIREKYKLPAQLTVRAITKTCDAYKLNKKIKPTFKKHGSITYDSRNLTFKDQQVSISTLGGRQVHDLIICDYFHKRITRMKGQVDLIYRKGKFFLHAICDIPEEPQFEPKDVIGVDLGVKNIAVTSDGEIFSNEQVEKTRKRLHKLRAVLQSKGTKSSKRKLKHISGLESRFRTHENHHISKYLVAKAKGTGCALALEDLSGINQKTVVRQKQRAERLSWAFYQLRTFITYKAKLAGVPVVIVDPRYTSQKCNVCGHTEKANRKSQSEFCCKSCGHMDHADCNGAKNIKFKRVVVNQPIVVR